MRVMIRVAIAFLASISVFGQCLTVPIPLSERLNAADYVFVGQPIAQKAYWDENRSNIYTLTTLEVTAYLKGEGPAQVSVITMGGVVGGDAQITYPSLKLKGYNEYLLMVNEAPAAIKEPTLIDLDLPQWLPYADSQGALTKQGEFYFDLYAEPKTTEVDLFERIESLTGRPARTPNGENFNPREGATGVFGKVAFPITNITPNPTNGGTIVPADFVTITGSGFGTESNVFYANADDGGATLVATGVGSDNISWSDTEVVNKPASDAGTGTVSVNGQTSSLTIDYAHTDINSDFSGFSEVTRQRYYLVDVDGAGGLTMTYNTSFNANTDAVAAYERALSTWRCATFVNFSVDKMSTTAIATAANDSVNVVTFDGSLPSGVLGRATSRFSGSGNGSCNMANTVWYLRELDVQFDPDPISGGQTWNYGPDATTLAEYDFESVAVHELGHGHGLGHRIQSGTMMHYAISNGSDIRSPNAAEIAGGDAKVAYSTLALCLTPGGVNGPMVALTAGTCSLTESADLVVTKMTSNATPDEGDTLTYTVTITNDGPDDATGISLTDVLPNGVTRTATAANASQGSFNEGSGLWTVGSLTDSSAATLGLEVTVDAGASSLAQPITNTTSGLSADQPDPNSANNNGSVGITVSDDTDLAVSKMVDDGTPDEGQTVTYTVTVTNSGPARATTVALTDALPTGVTRTATAPNPSQGSFNDGSGLWTVGTIDSGNNATLGLEVTVDAGASSLSQPITNTTSGLSLDQTDTNNANDNDSADITVSDDTDLAVTKMVSDATPDEGQTITYTVTVTNNGPARATSVALTDMLPSGVTRTATAPNPSQGSFVDGTGLWTVGTIDASSNATLGLEVTVDAGASSLAQPITNTTSGLTLDQTDTNGLNDNGGVDINVTDDTDLVVSKMVSDATPDESQTITYTVTVTNNGPARATTVALTDVLPAGVTRTATPPNPSQGSFVDGTGLWTVGTVDSGNNATLGLEVIVDAGASSLAQPITNTTSGLVLDQTDTNGANNNGSVGITVNDNTDLVVSKMVSDDTPDEGQTITYTVTITNNGPARATTVALTDVLPSGVTRTATAPNPSQGSFVDGSGLWTVGTIDSGSNATLGLEVTVDVGAAALAQPITNTTSGLSLDQTDTDNGNNNGSVGITVNDDTDLAVTMMVDDSTPDEGQTITYTITVSNSGPAQASNVSLSDVLPTGVTRTATAPSPSQGSFNDGTGLWTVGTIDSGNNATLGLEVTVDAGASSLAQPITNITSGLSLDQTDTNGANDNGSADITVSDDTDLAVGKMVDDGTPNEGQTITYTVTVTNGGPAQASTVALTDVLPTGVTRTATVPNPSQGSFNDGTGLWTVGTIDSGNNATLGLEVTVDAGASSLSQPITNSTSGLTLDQNDSNGANDNGSADINVSDDTDLAVSKQVDDDTPTEGQTITYTVTVTNNGPARATTVALTDVLPAGVTRTAMPANPSQGSFTDGSGLWTVGTIDSGNNATLGLEVTVDAGASSLSQPITNTTSGLSLDQTDTDGGNDNGSVDINVSDDTDIEVTKESNNSTPCETDSLVYTLTVTNNGPARATSLSLTDTMPAGVTRTATPPNASQGSYSDGSGLWTIGTVEASGMVTLELEVTVDGGTAGQSIVNLTSGLSLDQTDGNPANDQGSATINVQVPPSIDTQPLNVNACEGQMIAFTVVASGDGLAYQWFKDAGILATETNASLSFVVAAGDDGDYTCEVSNACNTVLSAAATLTIDAGTLGVTIEADNARGLNDVSLLASVTCADPPFDLEWTNLTTLATSLDNPWLIAGLAQTTVFEVTVVEGMDSVTAQAIVLVSQDPAFFDLNMDNCNDVADIEFLLPSWRMAFAGDANGDQFIDVRDFLYINLTGACLD